MSRTTKASRGLSRVERWHKFAEERIARLQELDYPELVLLRECAAIEGVTPAELIVDRLLRTRCGGAVIGERPEHCFTPEFNAYLDTEYERATARARNTHERSVVSDMVHWFTVAGSMTTDLVKLHGRRFVRHFYRTGDVGLYAANTRFVSDALERLRKAEANRTSTTKEGE